MLSMTAQDTRNMWEEELQSRSRLGVRLSQLDREKAEILEQVSQEKMKTVVNFKFSLLFK